MTRPRATNQQVLARLLAQAKCRTGKASAPDASRNDVLKATIPPLISGLVLLCATYYLSGAFSNAIQQQQAQVAAVKEMEPLLTKLSDPEIKRPDATATALSLSAFGTAAIGPLLNILQQGAQNQVLAASDGLRAIGLASSHEACAQFGSVLRNRTRLFTWKTQKSVITLAGELGCADLKPLLRRFSGLIERSLTQPDLKPYSAIVQPSDLSTSDLQKVQAALQDAITLLDQQDELQSDGPQSDLGLFGP